MGGPKRYPSPAAGNVHEDLGPKLEEIPRAKTRSEKQLSPVVKRERLDPDSVYPEGVVRPKTRGECVGGCRPCPFVSCKWNLWLDVTAIGSLHENFPGVDIAAHPNNCALDIADRGGVTLEEIGSAMNITRERVRQIEEELFYKLKLHSGLDVPQETQR